MGSKRTTGFRPPLAGGFLVLGSWIISRLGKEEIYRKDFHYWTSGEFEAIAPTINNVLKRRRGTLQPNVLAAGSAGSGKAT